MSKEDECKLDVLNFDERWLSYVLEVLEGVPERGKDPLLYETQADEEGNFQFGHVPDGKYTLVARGRAGINEATWEEEIVIQPGRNLFVKLSNPTDACVSR
ncbi:MAG: hypothetical protein ACRD2Y_05375 [Terriglobales bacterium]